VEVRPAIENLQSSLEHIASADELLRIIDDHLTALRRCYSSHPSGFTASDIEFLKSMGVISNHLRAFLELLEDLVNVSSLSEYEDIVSRLVRAKCALASFPVSKRIAKEIRALSERLPAIRQQDDARRQFRISARIISLEQTPRRCPNRHPMAIREGTRGYFWGCTRYPFCTATAQLTPEENHFLNS